MFALGVMNLIVLCCSSATVVDICMLACVYQTHANILVTFTPPLLSAVPLLFKQLPTNLRSHL